MEEFAVAAMMNEVEAWTEGVFEKQSPQDVRQVILHTGLIESFTDKGQVGKLEALRRCQELIGGKPSSFPF